MSQAQHGSSDERFQTALAAARGGDRTRAIELLTSAHAADGRHIGIRNALGVLHLEQGNPSAAIALLKPLAKELPNAAPIQLNLGNALVAARRAEDALIPLRRASQLDPANALVWYGYARALQIAGRVAAAVDAYRRVTTIDAAHVEAHANASAAHMFAGDFDAAEVSARAALALDGQHAGAHLNRAMALLARGRWAEGWAEYEWRERTALLDGMRRTWSQPRWNGEAVQGKTLLVHAEQGFGDTLQFVRWLGPLRTHGARIHLVAPTALVGLLASSKVADQVSSFSDPVPPHDVQVPLTGLPHRLSFHTDDAVMGSPDPYLTAPGVMDAPLAAWCAELPDDQLRIGLVWAGSGTHVNDTHRSISLRAFEPLLKRRDVTWVSLQAGERALDLEQLPRRLEVRDASDLLGSFVHTAQLLSQLDAVITVDSAVAHLAGALGKRTWLLLPRIGLDWRWAAESNGRRWYGCVEPVRQSSPGEWRDVMQSVHARLGGLLGAESTQASSRETR